MRVNAAKAWRRGDDGESVDIDPAIYLTSVHVSRVGVTVCREPDAWGEFRDAPDELTVKFEDGTQQTISGVWVNHFYSHFSLNGDGVNADTWLFPEPIDPDTVTSVTLGGVEIAETD